MRHPRKSLSLDPASLDCAPIGSASLSSKPSTEESAKSMGLAPGEVRKVLKAAQTPVSLDTPIGEEQDTHLGDLIEDRGVASAAEVVISNDVKQNAAAVLKILSYREE